MKKLFFFAMMLVAFTGMSLTSPITPGSGDPCLAGSQACGVFTLGKYKLDLSHGAATMEIPKAMLVESMKSGLSFAGTAECPGTFEIVNLQLSVDAAGDAKYTYDYELVQKMQSMEDYMLARYFNGAEMLHFNNIQVKDSAGEIITIVTVGVVVK